MIELPAIIVLINKIKKNPKIYLGKPGITILNGYLQGFITGRVYIDKDKVFNDSLDTELRVRLQDYIVRNSVGLDKYEKKGLFLHECLLETCDGDEEKALELFRLFDDFLKNEGLCDLA